MQDEQEVQQEQPVYMFYYWTDESGNPQMAMHPDYVAYFDDMRLFIADLRETQNKNWKPEERDAYLLFLRDLQNYIIQYVYTGYVQDYNQFLKAMEQYGENTNKLGYDLYNHQCEYLDKKASGHDFKLEKKKKK